MKKIILIIAITFSLNFSSYAQINYMNNTQVEATNQKLKEENGWNIFKLNKHISNFKSKIIYLDSEENDKYYVYYPNEEIKSYLNIPIKFILLTFDVDDKLVAIRIILDTEKFMDNFYLLNTELQKRYGIPTGEVYGKLNHEFSWVGGTAPLLYSNFSFNCTDKGIIELSVMYIDMVYYGYWLLKNADGQFIDDDGNPEELILIKTK
ncbi:MAG: hypothetical protein K1X33_09135 [Methanobacteriaceae archaeon]|nr:hypothetical protein [Methanobacteriaceae archaeon]